LREARRATGKPLVAIGGITLQNACEVVAAGADSVAVIGDLLNGPDLRARAREFLSVLKAFTTENTEITEKELGSARARDRERKILWG
jgi:thiamine monophosphate synthase